MPITGKSTSYEEIALVGRSSGGTVGAGGASFPVRPMAHSARVASRWPSIPSRSLTGLSAKPNTSRVGNSAEAASASTLAKHVPASHKAWR